MSEFVRYDYSRGKRGGWGVYAVGPAGWFRLPLSDDDDEDGD